MEYRQLGASGLMVPVLSFGTATFASEDSLGFAAVRGEGTGPLASVRDGARSLDLALAIEQAMVQQGLV